MDIPGSTPHSDPRQADAAVPSADHIDGSRAPSADPTAAGSGGELTVPAGPADQLPVAPPGGGHLFGYLTVYSLLRVVLVVVLTAALSFFMPLIVALLFAIIVQLPLAWLLFAGPRRRVNEALAQASAVRRAERARLQSALTGDIDPA